MFIFFVKIYVDDIDWSDGQDIVITFDAPIFLYLFHINDLISGDGEHVLYIVDIDVDKGVGEEDGRPFVAIRNEGVWDTDDEDNNNEYTREYDEDIASP